MEFHSTISPQMLIKFVNTNIISGVYTRNSVAAASGITLARAWMLRMFLSSKHFQVNRSLPLLAFRRPISINGTRQSSCDKAPCSAMLFPKWGQFFFSRYLRGENLQQSHGHGKWKCTLAPVDLSYRWKKEEKKKKIWSLHESYGPRMWTM